MSSVNLFGTVNIFGYPLRIVENYSDVILPDDHNYKRAALLDIVDILYTCLQLMKIEHLVDDKEFYNLKNKVDELLSNIENIRIVKVGDIVLADDFNSCLEVIIKTTVLLEELSKYCNQCKEFINNLQKCTKYMSEAPKYVLERGKLLRADVQNYQILYLKAIADTVYSLYLCLLKPLSYAKSYNCYLDGKEYGIIVPELKKIVLGIYLTEPRIRYWTSPTSGIEYPYCYPCMPIALIELDHVVDDIWLMSYTIKSYYEDLDFDKIFNLNDYKTSEGQLNLLSSYLAPSDLYYVYEKELSIHKKIKLMLNQAPCIIKCNNKIIPPFFTSFQTINLASATGPINYVYPVLTFLYNNNLIQADFNMINLTTVGQLYNYPITGKEYVCCCFLKENNLIYITPDNWVVNILSLDTLNVLSIYLNNYYVDSIVFDIGKASIDITYNEYYRNVVTVNYTSYNKVSVPNLDLKEAESFYYENGTVYYNPRLFGKDVYVMVTVNKPLPTAYKPIQVSFNAPPVLACFSTFGNNVVINVPSMLFFVFGIWVNEKNVVKYYEVHVHVHVSVFFIDNNLKSKIDNMNIKFDKAIIYIIPVGVVYNNYFIDWQSFKNEFKYYYIVQDYLEKIINTYFNNAYSLLASNISIRFVELVNTRFSKQYSSPLTYFINWTHNPAVQGPDIISTTRLNKFGHYVSWIYISDYNLTIYLLFDANIINDVLFRSSFSIFHIPPSNNVIFTLDDKLLIFYGDYILMIDFEKGCASTVFMREIPLTIFMGDNYLLMFDKLSDSLNIYKIGNYLENKYIRNILPSNLSLYDNYDNFNIYSLGRYLLILYRDYNANITNIIDKILFNISGIPVMFNINCIDKTCLSQYLGNEIINLNNCLQGFNINYLINNPDDYYCCKNLPYNVDTKTLVYKICIYDPLLNIVRMFKLLSNYNYDISLFGNIIRDNILGDISFIITDFTSRYKEYYNNVDFLLHSVHNNTSKSFIEMFYKDRKIVRVTFLSYEAFNKLKDYYNGYKGYVMFVAFLKDPKKIKNVIKHAEKVKANHIWIAPTSNDAVDFVFDEFYNFLTRFNKDVPKIYGVLCTTFQTFELDSDLNVKRCYMSDVIPLLLFKNDNHISINLADKLGNTSKIWSTTVFGHVDYYVPVQLCEGTTSCNMFEPSWYIYLKEWFNKPNNALNFTTFGEIVGKPITSTTGIFGYFCKGLFYNICNKNYRYFINSDEYYNDFQDIALNILIRYANYWTEKNLDYYPDFYVEGNYIVSRNTYVSDYLVEQFYINFDEFLFSKLYKYLISDILPNFVEVLNKLYYKYISNVVCDQNFRALARFCFNTLRNIYSSTVSFIPLYNFDNYCIFIEGATQACNCLTTVVKLFPNPYAGPVENPSVVWEFPASSTIGCIAGCGGPNTNWYSSTSSVLYVNGESNLVDHNSSSIVLPTLSSLAQYSPYSSASTIYVINTKADRVPVNISRVVYLGFKHYYPSVKKYEFEAPCSQVIRNSSVQLTTSCIKKGTCHGTAILWGYPHEFCDEWMVFDPAFIISSLPYSLPFIKYSNQYMTFIATDSYDKLSTSTNNIVDYVFKGYGDVIYDTCLLYYNDPSIFIFPEKYDGTMKITVAPLSFWLNYAPIMIQELWIGTVVTAQTVPEKVEFLPIARIFLPILYAVNNIINANISDFVDIYIIYDESVDYIPKYVLESSTLRIGLHNLVTHKMFKSFKDILLIFRTALQEKIELNK